MHTIKCWSKNGDKTMKGIFPKLKRAAGYTLIELMIALFLSMIAMTGIYKAFASFSANANIQDQVIAMNQDLRIGMARLVNDIGDAGYNPREVTSGTFGFVVAEAGTIKFSRDVNGGQSDGIDNDGHNGVDDAAEASYGDGYIEGSTDWVADTATEEILQFNIDAGELDRNGNAIISFVEAINFVYLTVSGTVLATPVATANLKDIASVQLTLVARTQNKDIGYVHNGTYRGLPNQLYSTGTLVLGHQGDNYRRKMMSTEVTCRNLFY